MFQFIRSNLRILTFCTTAGVFTALGQTFLIAQFIPHMVAEFDLSRTQIGLIYSVATLFASFWLSYLGKLLDKMSLLRFSLGTIVFLACGTLILGKATGVVTIFLGFFLIRTFGQMTLNMMATTTVSRIYGRLRGKVLALTGQGRSIGEGIFPILVVNLIAWWGWRQGIMSLGLLLITLMVPMTLLLVPRFPNGPLYSESEKVNVDEHHSWGWRLLFLEKKALAVMLINASIPFIFTGLFFQQAEIIAYKGWTQVLMGTAFVSYSVAKFISSFLWGALIDRYSARVMLIFQSLPLVLALIALRSLQSEFSCFIYMGLLGAAMGLYGLVRNSYWAEAYGLKVLGEIKGMDAAFLVCGTSISPPFFSFLLDRGVDLSSLFIFMIFLCFVGAISYLFIFFTGKFKPHARR